MRIEKNAPYLIGLARVSGGVVGDKPRVLDEPDLGRLRGVRGAVVHDDVDGKVLLDLLEEGDEGDRVVARDVANSHPSGRDIRRCEQ